MSGAPAAGARPKRWRGWYTGRAKTEGLKSALARLRQRTSGQSHENNTDTTHHHARVSIRFARSVLLSAHSRRSIRYRTVHCRFLLNANNPVRYRRAMCLRHVVWYDRRRPDVLLTNFSDASFWYDIFHRVPNGHSGSRSLCRSLQGTVWFTRSVLLLPTYKICSREVLSGYKWCARKEIDTDPICFSVPNECRRNRHQSV